jgi:hypothetical protein
LTARIEALEGKGVHPEKPRQTRFDDEGFLTPEHVMLLLKLKDSKKGTMVTNARGAVQAQYISADWVSIGGESYPPSYLTTLQVTSAV